MNPLSIHKAIIEATQILKQANIQTPRLDAEVILAHQLNWKRLDLITRSNETLDREQQDTFYKKINQRAQGVPVQYITGLQEFMGLDFNVSPDVLIPRPDTEILIEAAIEEANSMKSPLTIVDIGTGSGAIALSLAHFIKGSKVHTIDISPRALEVAKGNAVKLSLQDNVSFFLGDVFSPLGEEFYGKVDLLVSNPPYIPKDDILKLQREVGYEPELALDGGLDGLDFYRRIIKEGQKFLSSQGRILFEVGHDQAQMVENILREYGFKYVIIKKDLSGIERVVIAKVNS
jgi:release factor glutamine methyltransferase